MIRVRKAIHDNRDHAAMHEGTLYSVTWIYHLYNDMRYMYWMTYDTF